LASASAAGADIDGFDYHNSSKKTAKQQHLFKGQYQLSKTYYDKYGFKMSSSSSSANGGGSGGHSSDD